MRGTITRPAPHLESQFALLVHAAGEAGVVGSHELFHPQADIGLGGAFRNHLLGENAII